MLSPVSAYTVTRGTDRLQTILPKDIGIVEFVCTALEVKDHVSRPQEAKARQAQGPLYEEIQVLG